MMPQYEPTGSFRLPDPRGVDAETFASAWEPAFASDRCIRLPLSSWEPDVARRLPWWVWLVGLVAVTALCVGIVLYVADRATADQAPEIGWSTVEQQVREAAASRAASARSDSSVCGAR